MSTQYFCTTNESYQVSLKVEENINRKIQQKVRGRGSRGRSKTGTTGDTEKGEEFASGEGGRVGKSTGRGRGSFGRGKSKYVIACYQCGVEGHKKYECLEKHNLRRKGEEKKQVIEDDEASVVEDNVTVLE